MTEDDLPEALWIASGPPPEEPRGLGCLGLLSVLSLAGVVLASGFWLPLLLLGIALGVWNAVRPR